MEPATVSSPSQAATAEEQTNVAWITHGSTQPPRWASAPLQSPCLWIVWELGSKPSPSTLTFCSVVLGERGNSTFHPRSARPRHTTYCIPAKAAGVPISRPHFSPPQIRGRIPGKPERARPLAATQGLPPPSGRQGTVGRGSSQGLKPRWS